MTQTASKSVDAGGRLHDEGCTKYHNRIESPCEPRIVAECWYAFHLRGDDATPFRPLLLDAKEASIHRAAGHDVREKREVSR